MKKRRMWSHLQDCLPCDADRYTEKWLNEHKKNIWRPWPCLDALKKINVEKSLNWPIRRVSLSDVLTPEHPLTSNFVKSSKYQLLRECSQFTSNFAKILHQGLSGINLWPSLTSLFNHYSLKSNKRSLFFDWPCSSVWGPVKNRIHH